MLHRPEISRDDSEVLSKFYFQVQMARGGVSGALQRAQQLLASCSATTRNIAWSDVYDRYSGDAQFLSRIAPFYSRNDDFVPRAFNRMTQKLGKAYIAGGESYLREGGLRAVRRQAIKDAMTSLLGDDSAGAKDQLLAITEYAATEQDFKFLREGWLFTVEKQKDGSYEADKALVDRLSEALLTFQKRSATKSDVPKYVRDLQLALASAEQTAEDEKLGSSTRGELRAELSRIMAEDGGLRRVMDESKMRIKKYGDTVRVLMSKSAVKKILRLLRRDMADFEDSHAREQLAAGGVVMKPDNVDTQSLGHPYAKPLYDLTQEVSKKLGFTEDVTVVVATSIAPNAFVYTADVDRPRVTFFTSMLQKFWDFQKNDWLSLTLNADGKPVPPGTEGAREVPVGKLLTESVLAHELGHIRDQAILIRSLLIYLYLEHGDNLTRKIEDPKEKKLAEKLMNDGLQKLLRGACAPLTAYGADGAAPLNTDLIKERAAAAMGRVSERELKEAVSEVMATIDLEDPVDLDNRTPFFGELMRFIQGLMKISRAAEETADRYAVVEQKTAQWTGLVDAMLGLNLHSPGSEEEKRQTIADLIKLDPKAFAERQLAEMGDYEKEYTPNTEWILDRSHPVFVSRIMQDFDFAADKKGMAVRMAKWDKLPVEDRLLTVLKLHEKRHEQARKLRDAIKPHESYALTADYMKRGEYETRLREIEGEMEQYLALADEMVGEQGLLDANNAFVKQAIKYIKGAALDLTDRGSMYVLARRWRNQLNELVKAETLSEVQRSTATYRLQVFNSIVKDFDAS